MWGKVIFISVLTMLHGKWFNDLGQRDLRPALSVKISRKMDGTPVPRGYGK